DFEIRLNAIITEVRWSRGAVTVACKSGESFSARRAIVTLPIGVLQATPDQLGAVRFDPEISKHREAANHLVMGPVTKVVCRFREAFWEDSVIPSTRDRTARLTNMSFMFAGSELSLQTWWTMRAIRAPILIGWSGGPPADAISGRSADEMQS